MTSGGDSYRRHLEIELACQPSPLLTPQELKNLEARIERILLDDNREDTCGCSFAGWDWYRGVTLLGWIVVTCLSWWFAAKVGWEVGRWWIA